jgi:predicted ribosome quality control (RQC) complex YloA/Tae2 family protein
MARLNQQKNQGKVLGKGGKGRTKDKHAPPPLPPRSYTSSDGFLIQAGRNNIQNDRLTLRTAHKQDIWLHAQKIPGTHVIIRCGNQAVPDKTLEEAAQIAAWFSQVAQRQSGPTGAGAGCPSEKAQSGHLAKIPVDYCPVSHVRKIAGGRPGLVQYEGYQTLLVEPCLPLAQLSEPSDSIDA